MARPIAIASSLALVLLAGGAAVLTASAPATIAAPAPAPAKAADVFTVDAVHSSVVFRIKHMNVAPFYGRFNNAAGAFNLDFAKPEGSVLDVSVKTEDVDTANAGRDKHLKSEDFFSAKEYPTISFKGKAFKKTGDATMEVTGDLTLHGVTKPVTAMVEATGTGKGRGGEAIAGLEAKFTIKRSDFGMTNMVGPIGDEVNLMIGLEGAKK